MGEKFFGRWGGVEEQLTCIEYQIALHEGTQKGMTKSVKSSLL